MPAKTKTQPFDPSEIFGLENEQERLDGLRHKVLPRLASIKAGALSEIVAAFKIDPEQHSDERESVLPESVETGLHPAEGSYTALRGAATLGCALVLTATRESLGASLRITDAPTWRLFVKTLYQYREALGDYLLELEELYVTDEDDEEAVEELDQVFAVNTESAAFKASGSTLFFPALPYPVETEEEFDTLIADFSALFPFYWLLVKAALGEPVDADKMLNS